MHFHGSTNEYVDPEDLAALSTISSEQGPIFSLYLDLRPEKGDILPRFDNLLMAAEGQKKLDQEPHAYQQHWAREAEQVRRWVMEQPPRGAKGMVVFSGQAAGLWRTYLLPAPVLDRLVTTSWPYTRPLDNLIGEMGSTLAVLIDANSARLYKIQQGGLKEIGTLAAEAGAERAAHVGAVVGKAREAWDEHGSIQLVIGGSDDTLNALHDALEGPLRERLVGELSLAPSARPEQVAVEVRKLASELEDRLEAQHVQELIANMTQGGPAVVGMEQVLLAIRSKKVRLLLVEEDYHQPGGECPNCGYMEPGDETNCLLCGVALRPETDVLDAAVHQVLMAGARVDVLRSPGSREALQAYGRIGALVNDQVVPPEKDISNRRVMAEDGKIKADAVHDEAIEESFPASDPPSHTA